MLSRKDYVAIAEIIINDSFEDNLCNIIINVDYFAEHLADYFAADNPRFDRDRFMKACGL